MRNVSRNAIIFIVCNFLVLTLHAQTTLKEWQESFVTNYCECLERYSIGMKPGDILQGQTEKCIAGFYRDHGSAFESFVRADSTLGPPDMSDYEKGRAMGKRIMEDAIVMMVTDCPTYRQALSEFKHIVISQMLKPTDSVIKVIDTFKAIVPDVTDKARLSQLYLVIALLYEFAARKEDALHWYDESLTIAPTTTARGLRALLLQEN